MMTIHSFRVLIKGASSLDEGSAKVKCPLLNQEEGRRILRTLDSVKVPSFDHLIVFSYKLEYLIGSLNSVKTSPDIKFYLPFFIVRFTNNVSYF
jgi:hypothetical protein